MKRVVVGLAAAWTLMASAPAMAQDWSQTFHPDSLPEELSEISVVVATGGPGSAAAGQALRQNLREAGSPRVIDNPVTGDVEGIADQDVVERLKHLPVDAVVIVRTFSDDEDSAQIENARPIAELFTEEDAEEGQAQTTEGESSDDEQPAMAGILTDDPELIARMEAVAAEEEERREAESAEGDETSESETSESAPESGAGGMGMRGTAVNESEATASMAMITFYSIDGAAIAGFMVYPGVALTSEQRQNIGRGISQETFDATQSAMEDAASGKTVGGESAQTGRLRLQKKGLMWELLDSETGETTTRSEIYRQLGRDDLAASYDTNLRGQTRRATIGRITGYSGLVALVLGSGLAVSTYFRELPAEDPQVEHCSAFPQPAVQNNCRAQESFDALSGQRTFGIALFGAGVVAAITGAIIRGSAWGMDLHPLSFQEARALVNEANSNSELEPGGGGVGEGTLGDQALPQDEKAEDMSLELSPYFRGGPDAQGGLQLRGRW